MTPTFSRKATAMSTRQSTKVELICKTCGSKFFVQPYRVEKRPASFCSTQCYHGSRNLTGQTFGRWTVIFRAPYDHRGKSQWFCKCECQTIRMVSDANLVSGQSLSCGCYSVDLLTKHGCSTRSKRTPTYNTWNAMNQRCNNKNNRKYKLYGGRGISVCKRWGTFENFLEDMGERPPGTTIDRFPNQDGNYEKSNCRWATYAKQNRNMRSNVMIEFRGEKHCLSDWSSILGINRATLNNRIMRGWSVERAFTTKGDSRFRSQS